jgi:hypothetical protein
MSREALVCTHVGSVNIITRAAAEHLMVETAVPVSEDDGSWQVLPSGRKFSHDWGYGNVGFLQLISSHRIATEQTAITLGDVLMYSQPWRVGGDGGSGERRRR